MKINHDVALGYKDVYLVPNKCTVGSRKEVDTWYRYRNFNFSLPIMPSNMKAVIDPKTYKTYVANGVIPVMHRFDIDPYKFLLETCTEWKAISVGVTKWDFDSLVDIHRGLPQDRWPDMICIDIAHGHSDAVCYMMDNIRSIFAEKVPIIVAGNVTTPDGVEFLQSNGADMIKVGIGPGGVCSTKNKTGFHIPMFTAVMECSQVAKVPIIADGGIRENGDIAKALVAGADLVMVGGLFAACADSPAAIVDGKKEYYGSASAHNKGHNRNVEGFATHLTPTISIEDKIAEIKQDLQSAISYAGGKDLSVLDLGNVKFNIVL